MSPYSLSVPGGVQGQVLALARALRGAGHEAVVIGPLDGRAHGDGLPDEAVVGVGRSLPVPANGSVARLALGPWAARRTWAALSRLRPDVVHLHEPLAPGPTWAALARPEPKVGTFHRAGTVNGRAVLARPARHLADRLAVRVAVSEEAAATADALAPGTYEIIGNGVELERFRQASPWPTDGPTVLFLGRHERRKGLEILLDAFSRLDRALGARLWVVGSGPQTASLRRRFAAAADVRWLGALDDDELARRAAAAAVVCVPSLGGESFGVVLVEAMAARAVVVASDIPGYAAVLGSHGVLVPPGDAGALAVALGDALADVAQGRAVASPAALDAAQLWAERWSMASVAARYAEIYRRLTAAGSGSGEP